MNILLIKPSLGNVFFLKKWQKERTVLKDLKSKVSLFPVICMHITKVLTLIYNSRRDHILNYSRIRVILKYYCCDASVKVLSTLSGDMVTAVF